MTEATFQKSTLREYFESIVVAVILALFVRTFVFQAFKIPTGSMKPNLLVGDHLLVNKFIFAPAASADRARAAADARRSSAATSSCSSFPRSPSATSSSASIGLPGDTHRAARTRPSSSTAMPLVEPYAHYLFPPADDGADRRLRPAPQIRPGDRARRATTS